MLAVQDSASKFHNICVHHGNGFARKLQCSCLEELERELEKSAKRKKGKDKSKDTQ